MRARQVAFAFGSQKVMPPLASLARFSPEIHRHTSTLPPLKKICYPLKLFAILHWSLPSRTNTTYLWLSLTSLTTKLWGEAEGPTKHCYQSCLQIKRSPASSCHELIGCLYPFPSLPFSWEVLWTTPRRTHFQFFCFPPSVFKNDYEMASRLGLNQGPSGMKRELKNDGVTSMSYGIYKASLETDNGRIVAHCHAQWWQQAGVTATRGKVLLRDMAGALSKQQHQKIMSKWWSKDLNSFPCLSLTNYTVGGMPVLLVDAPGTDVTSIVCKINLFFNKEHFSEILHSSSHFW